MTHNSISSVKSTCLALAAIAVPTSAMAETCTELQTRRETAIAMVNEQSGALRTCLLSFPDWQAEAHNRYYDIYDVTETIPGQPRRLIINHGRYTSTAYIAPATKSRVERSVEYEDMGAAKRLEAYTPEEQARLQTLGTYAKVALGDEFLLCKGKVDPVAFISALASLGWGFNGGPDGITKGWDAKPWVPQPGFRTVPEDDDAEERSMPLSQHAVNRCLQREANAAYDAAAPERQAEANAKHEKFMEEQRRKVRERNARRRAGNWD